MNIHLFFSLNQLQPYVLHHFENNSLSPSSKKISRHHFLGENGKKYHVSKTREREKRAGMITDINWFSNQLFISRLFIVHWRNKSISCVFPFKISIAWPRQCHLLQIKSCLSQDGVWQKGMKARSLNAINLLFISGNVLKIHIFIYMHI